MGAETINPNISGGAGSPIKSAIKTTGVTTDTGTKPGDTSKSTKSKSDNEDKDSDNPISAVDDVENNEAEKTTSSDKKTSTQTAKTATNKLATTLPGAAPGLSKEQQETLQAQNKSEANANGDQSFPGASSPVGSNPNGTIIPPEGAPNNPQSPEGGINPPAPAPNTPQPNPGEVIPPGQAPNNPQDPGTITPPGQAPNNPQDPGAITPPGQAPNNPQDPGTITPPGQAPNNPQDPGTITPPGQAPNNPQDPGTITPPGQAPNNPQPGPGVVTPPAPAPSQGSTNPFINPYGSTPGGIQNVPNYPMSPIMPGMPMMPQQAPMTGGSNGSKGSSNNGSGGSDKVKEDTVPDPDDKKAEGKKNEEAEAKDEVPTLDDEQKSIASKDVPKDFGAFTKANQEENSKKTFSQNLQDIEKSNPKLAKTLTGLSSDIDKLGQDPQEYPEELIKQYGSINQELEEQGYTTGNGTPLKVNDLFKEDSIILKDGDAIDSESDISTDDDLSFTIDSLLAEDYA